jgi:hypothetical protein
MRCRSWLGFSRRGRYPVFSHDVGRWVVEVRFELPPMKWWMWKSWLLCLPESESYGIKGHRYAWGPFSIERYR